MAVLCLNLQPKNWEMKISIKENFSTKSAKQIRSKRNNAIS